MSELASFTAGLTAVHWAALATGYVVLAWHWYLVARGSWDYWRYPSILPTRAMYALGLTAPLLLRMILAQPQNPYLVQPELLAALAFFASSGLLLLAFSFGHGSYMNIRRVRGSLEWKPDNERLRHVVRPLAKMLGLRDGDRGYILVGATLRASLYGFALLPIALTNIGLPALLLPVLASFWFLFVFVDGWTREIHKLISQESLMGLWLALLAVGFAAYG